MKTVNIHVVNNTIEMDYSPLVTGNVETICFAFTFNEAWEGYAKTAVFYNAEDEKTVVVIANNRCLVPAERLETVAPLYFGVYGVMDEKRMVTETKCLTLEQGAYGTGSAPADPTPDVYSQIMTIVEETLSETDATLDEIETLTDALSAAESARSASADTAIAAANAAAAAAQTAADAANTAAASANETDNAAALAAAAEACETAETAEEHAAAAILSANAALTEAGGKQDKWSGMTLTLAVADWAGGTTCTKSVTGVTDSCLVLCDPDHADVVCTAQAADALTFTCTATPTAAVNVKVVIFA